MTTQIENQIKEIAYTAWVSAANAYRLYPDNKHTFSDFWAANKEALLKISTPDESENKEQ